MRLSANSLISKCKWKKSYSMCCGPPRRPTCPSGCPSPCCCNQVCPPPTCRPTRIPPNPCVPRYPRGKNTWKKYKYLALLVGFPLVLAQAFIVSGHCPPPRGECRDYEYMRIRTKRFPWGDGNKSFFHNDRTNHLPGECEPPPLDCD